MLLKENVPAWNKSTRFSLKCKAGRVTVWGAKTNAVAVIRDGVHFTAKTSAAF